MKRICGALIATHLILWAIVLGSVAAFAGSLDFKPSITTYTGGQYFWNSEASAANPGNFLGRPRAEWLQDFRPVLKLDSDFGLQAVAKPRLLITGDSVQAKGYKQTLSFEWIEAYAQATVHENFTVSVGAQNYQWGPGELFSPSNEVFRFQPESYLPLFYYRGRNLMRVGWTPTRDWSLIAFGEYAANGDPQFQADRGFVRKAAIKLENASSWNLTENTQASHVAAFVFGTDETQAHWLGQYGELMLGDSFSIYADASQNFRNDAHFANTQAVPGAVMMAPLSSFTGDSTYLRLLTGAKYVFPHNIELRLEYFYNGLGWSRDDYQNALQSLQAPNALLQAQNYSRFLQRGLEFTGRHYAYASLRVGDLGHDDKITFFLRYLRNLTDQSGSILPSFEWSLSNRISWLAALSYQHGSENTEATQIERARIQTAIRLDL